MAIIRISSRIKIKVRNNDNYFGPTTLLHQFPNKTENLSNDSSGSLSRGLFRSRSKHLCRILRQYVEAILTVVPSNVQIGESMTHLQKLLNSRSVVEIAHRHRDVIKSLPFPTSPDGSLRFSSTSEYFKIQISVTLFLSLLHTSSCEQLSLSPLEVSGLCHARLLIDMNV